MRLSLLIFVMLAITVGVMAFKNEKRTFVSAFNVAVIDTDGHPVSNIRVSEMWNAYSYDASGGADIKTNERGSVYFPEQWQEKSALSWIYSNVSTRLRYGVHASKGVSAFINISEPGRPSHDGYSCSDRNCVDHPQVITFKSKLSSKTALEEYSGNARLNN